MKRSIPKQMILVFITMFLLLCCLLQLANASDLEKVKKAIKKKGAKWEAGETSISRLPEYERELPLKGKSYTIHPDFTIEVNGGTYYWEHLGILDIRDYYEDWAKRKQDYIENGYYETLITTDDLEGVSKEKIGNIVQDLIKNSLTVSKDERFSKHHYKLYS